MAVNMDQSNQRVSVVIVTYNSQAVIGKCLASLPDALDKVIVVDNASTDDTCQVVEQTDKKIEVVCCPENLGFGRANNIGLREVNSDFALVLNPDTVLEENTISRLVEAAEKHSKAAIVAPLLYYEDGTCQENFKQNVFKREKQKTAPYQEPEEEVFPEYIMGAVMLLRMKCFEQTGFFDEHIFLFYEDDDICLRASQAGCDLVVTPKAKAMHLRGKSSPPTRHIIYLKNWHMTWSRLYLEKKYLGERQSRIKAISSFYLYGFKAVGYGLFLNQEKMTKYWARAQGALAFLSGKQAVR